MISSIRNNTAEKVIIEFLFFTINIIREERDKIHIIIIAVNENTSIELSKLSVSILLIKPIEKDMNKKKFNEIISQ
ncbi:hypothetical protein [Chryseobacterium sp. RLHN22]|uniref:hypothetical protein n=1 Tax=Chryseobacterium sp. RLHN22 TaxID=3437885 RepID=UPI003D9B2FAD